MKMNFGVKILIIAAYLFSSVTLIRKEINIKNDPIKVKSFILNGSYCFWDYIPETEKNKYRGLLFLSDSTLIRYDYTVENERVYYSYGDIAVSDTLKWYVNDSILQIDRFFTYKVIKFKNDSLVLDLYRNNKFINQFLLKRSENQADIPIRFFNSAKDKYKLTWQNW